MSSASLLPPSGMLPDKIARRHMPWSTGHSSSAGRVRASLSLTTISGGQLFDH